MALPLNVARVLTYFYRRITAYDLVGSIVDHEYKKTATDSYTFTGVLIPPTNKDLELFEEGELANGALVLYVNKAVQLYMADAVQNVSGDIRQTIVLFDGDEYRVKGYSNRSEDGIHRKYTLVRYMKERSNGET